MSDLPDEDPALERDLGLIPSDELRLWLGAEQAVLLKFFSAPSLEKGKRARWAQQRVNMIQDELARRSGRLPRTD